MFNMRFSLLEFHWFPSALTAQAFLPTSNLFAVSWAIPRTIQLGATGGAFHVVGGNAVAGLHPG